LWRALRARDPQGYALKRAVRAAVVVPLNFAVASQVIGNAQVATFAAFGSFALLLFTNFTGSWVVRARAYLLLAAIGVALISVGTAVAGPDWSAVAAMLVVAFAVLFSASISSIANGGVQAALLAFILAVMLPGASGALPDRLAGWGIAVAVSVPVALFVWPPRDQDQLRLRVAALCRALGDMLALEPPPPGSGDRLVAARAAARELRATFSGALTRTAGLSTGARMLIRLVDEVEWLATTVENACADAPEQWPEQGRRLRARAAEVLRSCGDTLDHAGTPDPCAGAGLETSRAELEAARSAVAEETLAELQARGAAPTDGRVRGEFERPLYAAHELGYVVALAGRTVALIAAADARSWWQRLLGRRVTADELGTIAVVRRVAGGQFDRHSVWLQNSVRGAAGLTLAVLLSRVVEAQNAFWIGLGALSVLRSNALSTGATVVRALLGTAVGFAVGGAVVAGLGTTHAVLWSLLPLVILVAASAPSVISFVAGQAAFTVLTIILFNIIAPAGWRIGVLRVEDVALGCLASLGAGLLFWPRGAAAALGLALGDAYGTSSDYLHQALLHATGRRPDVPTGAVAAMAAGERVDDALRQYLAEQGAKHVPLADVAALANGATRVRLAGTAIKRLSMGTVAAGPPQLDPRLAEPGDVLLRRGEHVVGWYRALADSFAGRRAGFPPPDPEPGPAAGSFLDVVLPAVDRCGGSGPAAQAERLLWTGQYLGDVDQLRADLLEPAGQVAESRARTWWRR
jgi:uncharacterized membrane protein YccC